KDHEMSIALGALQRALELLEERLPPLRVGPAEQLLGFRPRQLAAVQSRPDGATSSAALDRPLLWVRWPPCAGRRRPPRRVRLRAAGKKGTAPAGAAERERGGAALVISVHPIHHRVRPPACAH